MEETASPLGAQLQKLPPVQKWWQLPRTLYVILAVVLLSSVGSSAYLLLAPSGKTKPILEIPAGTTVAVLPTPTSAASPSDTSTGAESLTPTLTPTPTPDLTVGWLTYTNNVYGFSFKYPKDWKVTDLGVLEPKVPSYITINPTSVATPSSNLAITLSSSTRTYDEELTLHSATRTALTINTLTASKTQEQDSNRNIKYHVVIKGKKYVYIFVGKKAYESTFNLMYPTFTPL